MFDDVNDVVIFFEEPVEEMHYEDPITDWGFDVGKEVSNGFKLLAVVMNGQISNNCCAQVVFKLHSSSFFVVAEEIFDGQPEIACSAFGFEDSFNDRV